MPEGINTPKATEESITKTEKGGEEGNHCTKLTKVLERSSRPKKFSYWELMIATDSFADGRIP